MSLAMSRKASLTDLVPSTIDIKLSSIAEPMVFARSIRSCSTRTNSKFLLICSSSPATVSGFFLENSTPRACMTLCLASVLPRSASSKSSCFCSLLRSDSLTAGSFEGSGLSLSLNITPETPDSFRGSKNSLLPPVSLSKARPLLFSISSCNFMSSSLAFS